MFCPSCGKEIPDQAQYCLFCGKATQGSAGPSVQPGPPASAQALQPETSGKAIASLLLGILFFLLPAAILAVVFGHWSRSEIQGSGGRLKGAGIALTGLILGYIGVTIIPFMIIAAIAIPNLLRSRMAANEASAVGSLRTLNVAIVTYATTYGMDVPETLTDLGPAASGEPISARAADLIDSVLASGRKSGYIFTYAPADTDGDGNPDSYTINADPINHGITGQKHFFLDSSGVIRSDQDGPADARSPPLS